MKTMIILLFAVLTSVSVAGQNLTLIVKDVEHVDGSVYVAIYSSKQTFMKKPVFGLRVGVKDRTIEIPCKEFLPVLMPFPSFRMKMKTGSWIPVHSGVLWKSSGSAMMRKESWELLRLKNAVLNSNGTLRWLFI